MKVCVCSVCSVDWFMLEYEATELLKTSENASIKIYMNKKMSISFSQNQRWCLKIKCYKIFLPDWQLKDVLLYNYRKMRKATNPYNLEETRWELSDVQMWDSDDTPRSSVKIH